MRVIALLSLLFGFMGLMLLDGQTFTHAVMGIVFGVAAMGCGLGAARNGFSNTGRRWEGRILAGLGFVLAILCVAQLPSAYGFQKKFNERTRRQLRNAEGRSLANQQSGANAKQPFDSQANQTPMAAAPPQPATIPVATQAAISELHAGMTEEAALAVMKPVALDSGRVTWGGSGRGRLYFQVSDTQQFFLEVGPGPEFKVTRVGSLEPKRKWTRDSRGNMSIE